MGSNNFKVSSLVTLAVGVGIGVLIAPTSGRETRRRIMEKTGGAKDTLHYLVMEAGDLVDQLRSVVEGFAPSSSSNNGNGTYASIDQEEKGRSGNSS